MAVAESQLIPPRTLYLETTNRCNLRCKGCIQYRGSWEPERDLSLEDVAMITDQLPALERVVLHGIGEPLLNKKLPEIIRHLKKRRIYVLFNSNGIPLDEQRQDELILAGVDEVRISIDAASSEGYRAIRNSDAFDQLLGNLHRFATTLARCHANRLKISLWFLGTRENITELPGLIKIAADIGVPEVYLQRLVYFQDDSGYGVARQDKTLVEAEKKTSDLILESQELADRLGVSFKASGGTTPFASLQGQDHALAPWRKCHRPQTLAYITANGNVLPCCISPFATIDYAAIVLGNVFAEPFADIWRGSKYQNFRRQRQTGTPPVCCRGCGLFWSL
jgi:radical SAM protein with 4Fe4S-binding SPASM domain